MFVCFNFLNNFNKPKIVNLERLNANALAICNDVLAQPDRYDVRAHHIGTATVLDFAIGRSGTLAAGLKLAEICLAGLAEVSLQPGGATGLPLPHVMITTDNPLAACIGSQYAGWGFSHEKFFAMCSGPARLLRGKEDILAEYGLSVSVAQLASSVEYPPAVVGVFESNQLPSESAMQAFAKACGVAESKVTICIARTASLPGTLQVVARSVETALHKLHELHFDLTTIRSAIGSAPLPPIAADDLSALGWTNDAILYGGRVNLWVETEDEAVSAIADQLPSAASPDFGVPFLDIFNRYDRDFYKIDKLLFSPAEVVIHNLKTGRTFICGRLHPEILKASFGL